MSGSEYVVKRDPGGIFARSGRKPGIGRLDLELTERCNNDCVHCCINLSADDRLARSREMSADVVKNILRQAADLGCLEVRMTGGEPLLRPDFEELYVYARRLGLRVLLFTNARSISSRMADLFARMPPLAPIEITSYGMRPETYEAVSRAEGSFEQYRRGVGLLLERNVAVIIKSVILPQSREEIDEFEAWAGTFPSMREPPAFTVFLDLRCRRDSEEKNRRIEALRASPREALKVLARRPEKYRREMAEFASRFMGPQGDLLFGCGAGQSLCIDAYGRAQACMGLRAPELTVDVAGTPGEGPAVASSLAQALERFAGVRQLRSNNPEYLALCARCFLKGLCEQCPGKSWAETGTLDAPVAHLCEVAHEQARYMGWLGEKEKGWEVANWRERVGAARFPPGSGEHPACR